VAGTLFLLSDLLWPSKSAGGILYKTLEGKTFHSPTCKARGLHINNLYMYMDNTANRIDNCHQCLTAKNIKTSYGELKIFSCFWMNLV
jgi:hypothetical protein